MFPKSNVGGRLVGVYEFCRANPATSRCLRVFGTVRGLAYRVFRDVRRKLLDNKNSCEFSS